MFLYSSNLEISINNYEPIKFSSAVKFYSKHSGKKVSNINLQSQTGLECHIYYMPNRVNNEIKIYKNNFLVTRSQKHKRGDYSGYIIVPPYWELNLFENGFENDPNFISDTIDYVIKKHQLLLHQGKDPNELVTN